MTVVSNRFILNDMGIFRSFSAAAPREALEPRFDAEVRRLLRGARNPFSLAANPLARALCEATAIPDARRALRSAIENAFRGPFQEMRLRDILLHSMEVAPGSETVESQVSRRHLQRRRAKAVAILASYIKKIIGGPSVAVMDEEISGADPLETIAELVSNVEPAIASHIFRLGGPGSAANASMLAVRGRADMGAALEEAEDVRRYLAPSLVEILRRQSEEIAGRNGDAGQELWPLLTRAPQPSADVAEIRFELEWLCFLRARHSGDACQIDRVARNVKRLASDRASWMLRALLAQAEAKIRCGRLDEATGLLDAADRQGVRNFAVTDLAYSSALRAELALQRGDDASAERLAMGAYLVLRGRHFGAYRCQTTIARARLRLDEAWSCPEEVGILSEPAWDRVALDIESARHFFYRGDSERARTLSHEALQIAATHRYDGLAARAAATLGATFDRSVQERGSWYLRALSYLLATRDRSVGCDLFVLEKSCVYALLLSSSDEGLSDLLYDGLLSAIPHLRAQFHLERKAARRFLSCLILFILGDSRSPNQLDGAIRLLDRDASSFAQYLVHFLNDASDVLHTAFHAIVDVSERAKTEYRLSTALRRVATAIRPGDNLRQFLVG
jgi:hypothetical protein